MTVETSTETDVDASESVSSRDYRREKKRILIGLLMYSAVLGVVSASAGEMERSAEFLWGLPVIILGIMWCFADANERGRRLGHPMRIGLVLLFAFFLPIYLIRSRGWGAFASLFWLALFISAMLACSIATEVLLLLVTGQI